MVIFEIKTGESAFNVASSAGKICQFDRMAMWIDKKEEKRAACYIFLDNEHRDPCKGKSHPKIQVLSVTWMMLLFQPFPIKQILSEAFKK